jgi:hypothetical protein
MVVDDGSVSFVVVERLDNAVKTKVGLAFKIGPKQWNP